MEQSRESKIEEYKREKQEAALVPQRIEGPIGGLTSFNIEYGFVEGLLRGFRSGFLKSFEYKQLAQCSNFEDVKLVLSDTDYAQAVGSLSRLTRDTILAKVREKYVAEFFFLRSQASGPLATFLDFLTYEHLIDSFSFLVSGLINGSSAASLLAKCHPLGDSPFLKSILMFDAHDTSSDPMVDLYKSVLVDMPIGPYFAKFFQRELKNDKKSDMRTVYNEVEINVITDTVKKFWLEDFYAYVQTLGGESSQAMMELLEFEADRRNMVIVHTSCVTNSPLNEAGARDSDRKELLCRFGSLYPEATHGSPAFYPKAFSKVSTTNELNEAVRPFARFADLYKHAGEEGNTIEDQLKKMQIKLNCLAFQGQSHFAAFYAYDFLKRCEYDNIDWILTGIERKRTEKDKNKNWIPIFDTKDSRG